MYNLEELIEQLLVRYNNVLPDKELTSYELGVLIGQQKVIKYLSALSKQKTTK